MGVQYLSGVRRAIGGLCLLLSTTQRSPSAVPYQKAFGFVGIVQTIQSIEQQGADATAVLRVSSLSNAAGNPLFTLPESIEYVMAGGTPEFASRLSSITGSQGSLWRGVDILRLWRSSRRDTGLRYAKTLCGIMQSDGQALYSAQDVLWLLESQVQENTVVKVLRDGPALQELGFDGNSIMAYIIAGGSVRQAARAVRRGYSPKEIHRFQVLGVPLWQARHRVNTDKPNALLVYGSQDWNHAMDYPAEHTFVQQLRRKYDVQVRVVDKEQELSEVIAASFPLAVLVLNGHGTATTLSLAERDLGSFAALQGEEYRVDITDVELRQCLQRLLPDARIFLRACSNGEGGVAAQNLANAVATWAEGREVFSATIPFSIDQVQVDSVFPFRVRIANGLDTAFIDYTYMGLSLNI